MDFKQLEYFLTIHQEGSISKAAEKLYISQQGLSKAIMALEKELDCKLFDRKPKGILLTKAGESFLLHAQQMVALKNDSLDKMLPFREHAHLSIAMVIGARFSLPKGLFKGFLSQYPELDFSLQELSNENCLYNLEHNKADIAIVIQPPIQKDYCYQFIKKEPYALIVPTNHPFANREHLSLQDLDGIPLVISSGSSNFIFMKQCKAKGIQFSKIYETPGIVALYQTCSDLGIPGISLESMEGKLMFPNLKLIPINDEEVSWNITVMYKENRKRIKIVREFLEYLNDKVSNTKKALPMP